jgi:hypothetical protein
MKKELLSILLSFVAFAGISQPATNFTCNDCKGNSHDLFAELDAGKVIVLCWVMPCGSCVGPTLTTYNVVESYQANYPNTVFMYLCDDYANTNCVSLNSWASGYNIVNATLFSNSAISMTDYGTPGMPKIVVVAGTDHQVLYNSNNSVNATLLQEAINSALPTTGLQEPGNSSEALALLPNPANGSSVLTCKVEKASDIKIDLINPDGKMIKSLFSGNLANGEHNIELNFASFNSGIYFIKFSDGIQTKMIKIAVVH